VPKSIPVNSVSDLLPVYLNTPIEWLFRYHNFDEPLPPTTGTPHLFAAMCIDHRKTLHIPNEFAYVLRTAGARLKGNEFELTYAIAVGGVSTVALIGHTDCGMERVLERRDAFIKGLTERAGVERQQAEKHFDSSATKYAISGAAESVLRQTATIRRYLPGILVAPLLYDVDTDRLSQLVWSGVNREFERLEHQPE
jgi:carbonic anhydrase